MALSSLIIQLRAQGAEATRAAVRGVREEVERLGTDARRMGSAMAGASDRLKEVAGNALGAARNFALLSAAGAGAMAVFAFNVAAKTDNLVRGLASVETSAGALTRRLEELREVAKLPGLGDQESIAADIQLRAAGLSADLSKRSLIGFGNALASVGRGKADLDGVILALGQIASKGKVSAEEINQLNERVPQVRQAMIRAFGTADTEALDKLGITADVFLPKLIAEMEKLPRVSGGAQVALENLGDTFRRSVLPLGKGLLEMFTAASPALERLMSIMEERLTRVGEVLAAIGRSGVLADSLGKAIDGLGFGGDIRQTAAEAAASIMAAVALAPRAIKETYTYLREGFDFLFNRLQGFLLRSAAMVQETIIAPLMAAFGNLSGAKTANLTALGLNLTADVVESLVKTPKNPFPALQGDYNSLRGQYAASIMQNIKPLSNIPDGLTYGGGGNAPGATKPGGVKDKVDELLSQIERNTKRAADGLSLREGTTGGGELARLGVTPQELYSLGAGTGYRPAYADSGSVASDLERVLDRLIARRLQQQGAGAAGLGRM